MSRPSDRSVTGLLAVALVSIAMLMASLGQMVVGALAPLLREDLRLSAADIGLLGTTMFGAAAAWSLVAGRLTDRFGGRSQIVALYLLVAGSLGLMAAARSAVTLFAAMVLGGLALASQNPATNQLIARYAPLDVQPRLLATKQTGAQLAGVVAGILPAAAVLTGWRVPLVLLAAAAAMLAVISHRWLPSDSGGWQRGVAVPSGPRPSLQRPLTLFAALMGTGVGASVTYLPLYAFDALSLSASLAGNVLAYLAVVGALALLPWVRFAARIGAPSLVLTLMAGLAAVAIAVILAASQIAGWLLWPGLTLLGMTYTTWLAVAMLAIVRARPREGSGRLSGVVLIGFFTGMTLGPATFGQLVHRASYGVALLLVSALFAVGAGVAALSHRQVVTRDVDTTPPAPQM